MSKSINVAGALSSINDAFLDGAGLMPVNPLISAAFSALLRGGQTPSGQFGGWESGEGGLPVYRHVAKKGGLIEVSVEPMAEPSSAQPAWQMVADISPLTLDVLVTILAQLCDPRTRDRTKYPACNPQAISAGKIMGYKKLALWSDNRAQFIARISEEMRRLQSLKFRLVGFPVWDPSINKWNASGITVSGVELFEISEPMPVFKNGSDTAVKDCVWFVRLGQWAQWWLNVSAKVWLGPAPVEMVRLDHRKNRGAELLAKKIMLSCLLLWSAIRSRAQLERRVESLLEDIGELPPGSDRTAHWAGRMRDRFDEALILLKEMGLVEEVIWSDRFAPGACDRNKGWVEPWLASKIAISRPSRLFGTLEATATRKKRRARGAARPPLPPVAANPNRGHEIRARRSHLNITQSDLARVAGVSASYLSQIETGRVSASRAIWQRMDDYLRNLAQETN